MLLAFQCRALSPASRNQGELVMNGDGTVGSPKHHEVERGLGQPHLFGWPRDIATIMASEASLRSP